MADFPKIEVDVSQLASTMLAGYGAHIADFPSADVPGLMAAKTAYTTAHTAHLEADAAARVAHGGERRRPGYGL